MKRVKFDTLIYILDESKILVSEFYWNIVQSNLKI